MRKACLWREITGYVLTSRANEILDVGEKNRIRVSGGERRGLWRRLIASN